MDQLAFADMEVSRQVLMQWHTDVVNSGGKPRSIFFFDAALLLPTIVFLNEIVFGRPRSS